MNDSVIVVDNLLSKLAGPCFNSVIPFESYLHEYPKLNQTILRIINLCDTKKYLSEGYYCSLLAEARKHVVIPSVKTINEMRGEIQILLDSSICTKSELHWFQSDEFNKPICILCGETTEPAIVRVSKLIFKRYPVPIIKLTKSDIPSVLKIERLSLTQLPKEQQKIFINKLMNNDFLPWNFRINNKKPRWKMAILVNPAEPTPPSNKGAINLFVKAAAKLGIKANLVVADDLFNLSQYDALFIRETTAIDHHTYRMVCEAEKLGLVVIDDSTSILRCCNKVFLHDAFTYKHVPSLKTNSISHNNDNIIQDIENEFEYPVVLKMPESSFSH